MITSGLELDAEPKTYGPVVANDTLADIAIKLKGDGPWHYQRWMYALYQKNPQAFFSDNMNNIKLGARLIVPTERELEQVDLAKAFRAVNVQLYVLKQQRRERRETDEELLLRARMQRLFVSNEMMQQQSGELFDRISVLEQQVGSVVDRVLESEGADVAPAMVPKSALNSPQATVRPALVVIPDDENRATWWRVLLAVAFVYGAGFVWRRRVEATL